MRWKPCGSACGHWTSGARAPGPGGNHGTSGLAPQLLNENLHLTESPGVPCVRPSLRSSDQSQEISKYGSQTGRPGAVAPPRTGSRQFCGCHPESPVLTGLAGDSDTREPPISGLKIVKLACFLRSHCPEFQGETPDCLCFLFFLKVDDPTPFDIQAEMTLKTNFFGTRNVCTELLPIIKPHGEFSVYFCQQGESGGTVPQRSGMLFLHKGKK